MVPKPIRQEENWSCWNEIFKTNGNTLWDKKRSTDIREQLGIFNINEKLTQYKINSREHIQRIDDSRLSKTNLNYKPEGRRNIGRPQTKWKDDFREEGTCQGA